MLSAASLTEVHYNIQPKSFPHFSVHGLFQPAPSLFPEAAMSYHFRQGLLSIVPLLNSALLSTAQTFSGQALDDLYQ